MNSTERPWKRFTCECRGGYHGDNCDQPIRSCQGYAHGSRKPGIYKVVGYDSSVYEVYCHFDQIIGAMTLVQSYSFANISNDGQFRQPLYENKPISENRPTWSGYRLSKPRMKSIKDDSDFLLFTCEYEKNRNVKNSDYFVIPLKNINVDVIETSVDNMDFADIGYGKFRECLLNNCKMKIHQEWNQALHVHIKKRQGSQCECSKYSCHGFISNYDFFGSYKSISNCVKEIHSCAQKGISTSQLWFGTTKA